MSGETVSIGSGHVTVDDGNGQTFDIDLVGTIRFLNELKKQHEGKPHFDYLDAIAQHVQRATGAAINLSQADALDDMLVMDHWIGKAPHEVTSSQADALDDMLVMVWHGLKKNGATRSPRSFLPRN